MDTRDKSFGVIETPGITIDFAALFMEILDKFVLIILVGIVCGLLTYIGCSTIIPLNYESTTAIYVMPQSTDVQASYVTLEVGSLLTTDYLEMITSRDLIEDTITYFGLDEDENYDSFCNKVQVENPTDTRIIYITIKDHDPYLARNMVVYLRDQAIKAFGTGMGIEGITIFQNANLPTDPAHSAVFWTVIVAFLGCVFSGAVVVIRYIVIDKIVSADDIEKRLHYPVLGTVAFEKNYQRGVKK